jgi:PBP1b-binding outer membrane lipoprotein LpoB
MFKVMIIAILFVLLILSGCEKDEVAPIAEKTIDLEQSTEANSY